jgi:hypothetical protein
MFRFKFQGTHQNQATSGILTFRIYIGANAGQTIVLATAGSARAQTYMDFEGMATVRTTGASGTFISTGIYVIYTSTSAAVFTTQGAATTTTVDTTAATPTIKITAQWATASTTNTLLIQNASIELVKT